MLGIHRYSYHKRGYRILSESSSLLSENSLAIQNLVSRSRNEISRADLINITPRSIPRRSVDACTHASIAQTGEYRLPRACIHYESDTRDMQQTFPRAIYASKRHRNRSRNRSLDRAIKGQRELPRWQTSIDTRLRLTSALFESARLIIIWQPYSNIDSRLTIRCHSQASYLFALKHGRASEFKMAGSPSLNCSIIRGAPSLLV